MVVARLLQTHGRMEMLLDILMRHHVLLLVMQHTRISVPTVLDRVKGTLMLLLLLLLEGPHAIYVGAVIGLHGRQYHLHRTVWAMGAPAPTPRRMHRDCPSRGDDLVAGGRVGMVTGGGGKVEVVMVLGGGDHRGVGMHGMGTRWGLEVTVGGCRIGGGHLMEIVHNRGCKVLSHVLGTRLDVSV